MDSRREPKTPPCTASPSSQITPDKQDRAMIAATEHRNKCQCRTLHCSTAMNAATEHGNQSFNAAQQVFGRAMIAVGEQRETGGNVQRTSQCGTDRALKFIETAERLCGTSVEDHRGSFFNDGAFWLATTAETNVDQKTERKMSTALLTSMCSP